EHMDTSHENRERVSHAHLPCVVIVGGGFGGLNAARGLARAQVTVTIIDKHNYHLFRPMLYQVVTGLLSSDEVAAPIRSILRRQKNVRVLRAEVVGVDPHARVVFTREGTVACDYLVRSCSRALKKSRSRGGDMLRASSGAESTASPRRSHSGTGTRATWRSWA